MTEPRDSYRVIVDPGGLLRWRLLAGNGRTVGVSALSYPDAETARQAALAASRLAERLVPSYGHPDLEYGWIWSASDPAGHPVARGARSYERRATCMIGYQRFVEALRQLA